MRSTWLDPIRRRRVSAYRAGGALDDAVDVCRRLATHGLRCIVGYAPAPGEGPRAVADVHLAAIDRLSADGLDAHVSVKLSALGFDPALLSELAAAAGRSSAVLYLDALAPDSAAATWRLLERTPHAAGCGTTLPGRWRRSVDDVPLAVSLGLAVRVVKGQWPDAADPGADPARGFLRVVDRLCGHDRPVGVATHDVGLLRESLRRLRASDTPCEAELYYGLPFRAPALAARDLGVPIRVYVPFGHSGAPYGVADAAGNPAVVWWLAQDVVLGEDKTWRSIGRARSRA